ncbi:hypothetical protein Tco_1388813 [Tanacetum coccineum]
MGRDVNNQMYPIAWAVVKVENIKNWSWFLSLLQDDLNLQQGTGLTLILDSQEVWARTYQHFIRLVPGTNLWKRTNNQPPLPSIVRAMPGRPTKKRIKAAAKGRGRGSRGGGRGAMGTESGGRGQMGAESGGKGGMGSGIEVIGTDSGDKEGSSGDRETMGGTRGRRSGTRERRGGGRGGRKGGGRGSTSRLNLMDEDDIRQSMEDEYMQGLLDKQEDLRQKQEKEHQNKLYEEALQQSREEEFIFPDQEVSMDVEMYNRTKASINFIVNTQESITHGKPSSVEAANVQPAESEPANVLPV